MRHYCVNIQKGGAVLAECRRLVAEWQPGEDRTTFADRVMRENLLGKRSRSRLRDVLCLVFFRRFPIPVANNLHCLVEAHFPERDLGFLLYYHTALADDLLYDFVSEYLYPLNRHGQMFLDTEDGKAFIHSLERRGYLRSPWSDEVVRRTSRGLLATCRDFGLLEGFQRKKFTNAHVSDAVFLYIAHYLKTQVSSPGQLIDHSDWRLFFMDDQDVERRLLLAHQTGALRYEAAGGIRRLDWTWDKLDDYVGHLVEGAH